MAHFVRRWRMAIPNRPAIVHSTLGGFKTPNMNPNGNIVQQTDYGYSYESVIFLFGNLRP